MTLSGNLVFVRRYSELSIVRISGDLGFERLSGNLVFVRRYGDLGFCETFGCIKNKTRIQSVGVYN